jgi:hypothetical protein
MLSQTDLMRCSHTRDSVAAVVLMTIAAAMRRERRLRHLSTRVTTAVVAPGDTAVFVDQCQSEPGMHRGKRGNRCYSKSKD